VARASALDVLAAVWGPDPVSYAGARTVIDRALVFPKPAGRIPVLLADVDELVIDLQFSGGFTGSAGLLDTGLEIGGRAIAAGA
jgi:hypothetical protein